MNNTTIIFSGNQTNNNQLVGKIIVNAQETNQICNIEEVLNSITSALESGTGSLTLSNKGAFYLFEFKNNNNTINISFNKLEEKFYEVYIEKLKSLLNNPNIKDNSNNQNIKGNSNNIITITLLNNGKDEAEKNDQGNTEIINALEITNYLLEQTNHGNLNNIVTNNDFDKIIYHLELKDDKQYEIIIPSNAIFFQKHIINKLNNIMQIYQESSKKKTIEDNQQKEESIVKENLPHFTNNPQDSVNSNVLQKPKEAENFFMNLSKKKNAQNPFATFVAMNQNKMNNKPNILTGSLNGKITYQNKKSVISITSMVLITFVNVHKCIFKDRIINIK